MNFRVGPELMEATRSFISGPNFENYADWQSLLEALLTK